MMVELAAAIAWKAGVTALVIITVALVAERAGPVLAAILMGMPVSIGPALALLAYTHGEAFVADSARFSLASVFSVSAFLLGYVRASRRCGLWGCLIAGYVSWLVAALIISRIPLSVTGALAVALAGLVLARVLLPRIALPVEPRGAPGPGCSSSGESGSSPLPRRRQAPSLRYLLVRGLLGGLVVSSVVAGARGLGPSLAGLFASFPVVFGAAAWMLASIGSNRLAAATLSHADRGLPSFLAFCLTVSVLVTALPAWSALTIGLAASVAVSLAIVARAGALGGRLPPR